MFQALSWAQVTEVLFLPLEETDSNLENDP